MTPKKIIINLTDISFPIEVNLFRHYKLSPVRASTIHHVQIISPQLLKHNIVMPYIWHRSGVFIVKFEQIPHIVLVFALLTLNSKCRLGSEIVQAVNA